MGYNITKQIAQNLCHLSWFCPVDYFFQIAKMKTKSVL